AFETVGVKEVAPVVAEKQELNLSSFKEARAVVEAGSTPGWGHVLDIPIKQDKFGLGYSPQAEASSSSGSSSRGKGPILF
ncbi:hypothetical protein, partial [Escherichia coli]|uniref:hypothetical protein n=1 Tax=Escherichia coli TaxID=562 RepID=UPI0035935DDC